MHCGCGYSLTTAEEYLISSSSVNSEVTKAILIGKCSAVPQGLPPLCIMKRFEFPMKYKNYFAGSTSKVCAPMHSNAKFNNIKTMSFICGSRVFPLMLKSLKYAVYLNSKYFLYLFDF